MNTQVQTQPKTRSAGNVTLPQLWRQRCKEWGDKPALRYKRRGIWRTTTWAEYFDRARSIGLELHDLGLKRGDVVSILSANRPEWLLFEMGAQSMGYVVQGLYPTSSAEDLSRLLQKAHSRVVLVDDTSQLQKVLDVRDACPDLLRVVIADPGNALRDDRDRQLVALDRFINDGHEIEAARAADFDRAIDLGTADEPAVLACTAGTGKQPRSVLLQQRNLMHQVAVGAQLFALGPDDHLLSILSMGHVAERMAMLAQPLAGAPVVHFPESGATVLNDLREVAPCLLMGPPRLWDRLKREIEGAMAGAMPMARRMYEAALAEGAGSSSLRRRLVLPNLLRYTGLQDLRMGVAHGAMLAPATRLWFDSLGIKLRAGYGLAETSGLIALEPATGGAREGSVRPVEGVELRVDEGGAIHVRGPLVGAGYRDDGADTLAQTDGWLNTGDLGDLAADGSLLVHDRIDRLIHLRSGSVAPARVEARFRDSPYIADLLLVANGDERVDALVVLAQQPVEAWAREKRVTYAGTAELAGHPDTVRLISGEFERINAELTAPERVRNFRILPRSFSVDDEEMGPVMTLRRTLIGQRYAPLIAEMRGASPRPFVSKTQHP